MNDFPFQQHSIKPRGQGSFSSNVRFLSKATVIRKNQERILRSTIQHTKLKIYVVVFWKWNVPHNLMCFKTCPQVVEVWEGLRSRLGRTGTIGWCCLAGGNMSYALWFHSVSPLLVHPWSCLLMQRDELVSWSLDLSLCFSCFLVSVPFRSVRQNKPFSIKLWLLRYFITTRERKLIHMAQS